MNPDPSTSHMWVTCILRIVFGSYLTLIVALSLMPDAPMPSGMSDKVAHFGAYALLTVLGMPLVSRLRTRAFMVLSIVGLGALMEAVQAIVPRRDASGGDLLADALGTLAGLVVWFAVLWFYNAVLSLASPPDPRA